MPPERCADHDKLSEVVIRMEEKLDTAIRDTRKHIEAGSKWRMAIVVACIGMVGIVINSSIRFGIMENRTQRTEEEMRVVKNQIYDLNYVRGREEGMAESRKGGQQ